jgi:hypothetical protein
MSPLVALILSIVLVLAATVAIARFLRRPLHALLVELCGNEARAGFWSVYWSATLLLAALLGLLVAVPLDDPATWRDAPVVPLVLASLRAGLWAVLLVVSALAVVLLASIDRYERGQRGTHRVASRRPEPEPGTSRS